MSDDEDAEKDTSKEGRSKIEDIDQDAWVSLVQIDAEDQGRFEDETNTQLEFILILEEEGQLVLCSGGNELLMNGIQLVLLVGAGSIPLPECPSKDKRKAIMTESKPEQATTKLKQRLEIAGYEAAIRLKEQLDEEESQRIAKDADDGYMVDSAKPMRFGSTVTSRLKKFLKYYKGVFISFVPMDSELEVQRLKRAGQEVFEKTTKRQKIEEASDWEVYIKDSRKYWKISLGSVINTEAYQTFDDMLKKFDRDDLDKLWSLVKERFSSTDPTDDKDRILWVGLKSASYKLINAEEILNSAEDIKTAQEDD
ncbi:hypothetical protein Tco_0885454 [Tanacetum coccineum]